MPAAGDYSAENGIPGLLAVNVDWLRVEAFGEIDYITLGEGDRAEDVDRARLVVLKVAVIDASFKALGSHRLTISSSYFTPP